jgi:hypothetical protein
MKSYPNKLSFLLAGAVLSAGCWSAPLYASGNPWFDDFVAYDNAKGNAYTASTDAAILAWQESYVLRSYLNLYEVSQDTAWLTRFTDHFDTVMGTAWDSDGDGYNDWTTARYSPNPVLNSGFETADAGDPTLPENWIRSGSTAATAFRTDAPGAYIAGNACSSVTWGVELVTAGATLQRLYQDIPAYLPGHRYELSVYAKNGGSVDARAFVYDRTTGTVLGNVWVTSASWKNHLVGFVMPAAGHDVEVWLSHAATTTAGDTMHFDLIRVSPFFSYHVLDGMIGIPAARFVRLVGQNATTLASFQTKADTYQAFLEDHVVAKWEDPAAFYGNTWVNESATEGYYAEPSGYDTFASGSTLSPLPHNQYLAILEVQDILHAVNASTAYRTKADQGATFFANRLTMQGSAYFWYYGTHAGAKIEDASHANVDLEFVTSLHRSGGIFSGNDMETFTNTLTDFLWNGSTSAPEQNNLVNGTQGSYCTNYQFSRDMFGWIPYAQFDPLVWYIGAAQYAAVAANGHSEAATLSEIIKWDPVKLTNQGFELADSADPTLPARWVRSLSTAATAFSDGANASRGAFGLTLVSNGTQWQKLKQSWSDYVARETYVVTFDAKVDASGADGRVWVVNDTTGTAIASYNVYGTSWATYSFTFTAPANATDAVTLQLGHRDYTVSGGQVHFDNVSIKRDGDAW